MNELFDYLNKQIETGDSPVSCIVCYYGIDNYFELLMKNGSVIAVKESYPKINKNTLCPNLKMAIKHD